MKKMEKAKKISKYFLAALLPLCVLLTRPLTPAVVLAFGQEIRLATEPVDPRDIFRGDYVTLSFSIERADRSLLSEEDERALEGRLSYSVSNFSESPVYLYVTLSPDEGGIWQPVKLSIAPPGEGVYLRARARRDFDDTISLNYGDYLMRYYVKENTGRELETAAQRGELEAVVKVWRGRPVLTELQNPD